LEERGKSSAKRRKIAVAVDNTCRGVTNRLLAGYLGITLFVLVALEVPLGIQNQRTEQRTVEMKVEHDASTLASLSEDAIRSGSATQLGAIASRAYDYSRTTGARVVFVDHAGRARIDTSARVAGAETFASRPEIRSALHGAVAAGTRRSRTLHARLLYVALPIASGGVVHGAVRITYPMSAVDARVLRYWLILAAIAAVVIAAALLIGVGVARFVSRPLRRLEDTAAAVGDGDLDARGPEDEGPPEVRSLAAVFNGTVEKVARLVRSQAEFVADASHELRTPLTALRLRLESLEHRLDAPGRRDLDAAVREVDRLGQIVDGLLSLARADAGAVPAQCVDVAATVRERVETLRSLADKRGITLVAATNGPVVARVGTQRLAQVLDNLVGNALAHSPRGTAVTVSAATADPWIEVHVRDMGPGLTPEQRSRAFDRFWRAGSGPNGSGLGLAIVRKLVETDEGEVELAAPRGGGTDAVVRLRIA
jgi:signal transduction histidine kinase